ncbi:MAG: flagellar protein export ATPase FliI [Campylobacterales bacterium]|nr:flagellar protein export ATPase FliI [Campylobacterales bacterium]
MGLKKLKKNICVKQLSPLFGVVKKISPTHITGSGLNLGIGDTVKIDSLSLKKHTYGMVTEINHDDFIVTPFGFIEGFRNGDHIFIMDKGLRIPVGENLLGRVLNPFMEPLDGEEAPVTSEHIPIMQAPIAPMKRGIIDQVLSTGVKSIDGLLTCGLGQKMGIFAGSGVGKSTLMGMIVKGSNVPIKVIALIGERGREIPEFVQNNLNGDLTNTVIITATSDDSPLMRKYGAFSAMAVAEYFKNQGRDVLFIMDSVTRFAMAQREIGLSLGEPPTTKGYPPSVFSLLPQLMERAGKEEGKGTITAFFTVLIEGDDMNDPIADQARSILDGHIVLSREMTDYGIYPPVNILSSASRLFNDLNDDEHKISAQTFRKLYALLKENEVLIRIGAYTSGTDPELDSAISKKEILETFLKQGNSDKLDFPDTKELLNAIFSS